MQAFTKRRVVAGVLLVLVAVLLLGAACDGPTARRRQDERAQQPYAGLQNREIRALAPEEVADLLAGRGAGYALAAELNHHPGPMHVLELVPSLGLRPEQEDAVQRIKAAMQERAQVLGRQLVELERQLDIRFRSGEISAEELGRLTSEIAEVEGELRRAHLEAHVETKKILSPDQVARYDELRGYASSRYVPHARHRKARPAAVARRGVVVRPLSPEATRSRQGGPGLGVLVGVTSPSASGAAAKTLALERTDVLPPGANHRAGPLVAGRCRIPFYCLRLFFEGPLPR